MRRNTGRHSTSAGSEGDGPFNDLSRHGGYRHHNNTVHIIGQVWLWICIALVVWFVGLVMTLVTIETIKEAL